MVHIYGRQRRDIWRNTILSGTVLFYLVNLRFVCFMNTLSQGAISRQGSIFLFSIMISYICH